MSDVVTPWLAAANVIGWLAAAMTLLTFHCNDMLRLRLLALSANVAFVAYGLAAGLLPVLALHLLLIPLNLLRLQQARRLLRVAAAPVPAVARRVARAPLAGSASSLRKASRRSLAGAAAPAPAPSSRVIGRRQPGRLSQDTGLSAIVSAQRLRIATNKGSAILAAPFASSMKLGGSGSVSQQ